MQLQFLTGIYGKLLLSGIISVLTTVPLFGTITTANASTETTGRNRSIAILTTGSNDRVGKSDPNLQSASRKAEYYNKLASDKYQKQDYQGALADLNRAIELRPNYGAAYHNRGLLKADKLQDFRGALADLNRAIELKPNNASAYSTRGTLKASKIKDFQGALSDLDRAIQLNANDANAYSNRATLKYEYLKNRAGGITDIEQAVKLFRQQGNQKEAQRLMGTMKQWQIKDNKVG